MDLDWNDLKFLEALSRGGSVAGAARLMSVDASTVSRRLAAIEEAVGARLVLRTGRELQWTPEGRLALATAARIGEQVEALGRSIRASTTGVSGTVRVSCTPATVVRLSAIVAQARERFPELTVELSGQLVHADLAKGEADIAVRGSRPSAPDIVVRRGVDVGWYVVASPAYAAQHGLPRSEEQIHCHAVVLYGTRLRDLDGPRWLEQRSEGSPGVLRLDSPDAAAHAVAAGAGVGILPYPALHGRSDLVRVFDQAVAWAHLWILYHEAQREAARVRAVVDLLVQHFADERHCYSGEPPPPPPAVVGSA